MELATVHLKLSTQNVVVKHDVTPPQLAMYAFMHGEDCVESLKVTGVDKTRKVPFEMDRLRKEFLSENAVKALNTLFPGRFPHLPVTFSSIGYDPEMLQPEEQQVIAPPQAKNQSEAAIMQKIQAAAAARKEGAESSVQKSRPLNPEELADALDDTGDDEEDSAEFSDDPLDKELNRLENEGGRS